MAECDDSTSSSSDEEYEKIVAQAAPEEEGVFNTLSALSKTLGHVNRGRKHDNYRHGRRHNFGGKDYDDPHGIMGYLDFLSRPKHMGVLKRHGLLKKLGPLGGVITKVVAMAAEDAIMAAGVVRVAGVVMAADGVTMVTTTSGGWATWERAPGAGREDAEDVDNVNAMAMVTDMAGTVVGGGEAPGVGVPVGVGAATGGSACTTFTGWVQYSVGKTATVEAAAIVTVATATATKKGVNSIRDGRLHPKTQPESILCNAPYYIVVRSTQRQTGANTDRHRHTYTQTGGGT
ncbi:Hypp7945 [Branchiostoma lanceolatum]|uniref:Hypp7945 protein n=1 Tax=Branchiostoma lanceolatum TaxID=7740 RepID=A0A8K0ED97_BRALA|nr:Hypp7945 [Branchiostoma lanceolatum]